MTLSFFTAESNMAIALQLATLLAIAYTGKYCLLTSISIIAVLASSLASGNVFSRLPK